MVEVQFTQPGFPWSLDLIKEFYSADEFIVRGLSTRNRDSGLGAPLIAVTQKVRENSRNDCARPATVFLRVSGDVRDWSAGKLDATLELYSAFDATQVEVNGKPVPLQTDTTAPIAQGLNNSPIWNLGLAQFFSAEPQVKTGIRLMEPYSPGQIPVVFVHGTASSPVWWAEMWNTLNADPVLRKRYQFWMFNYASGNPITYSAGILRNDLMDQVKTLDPDGKDPALRQMVIIGHSQGGLLAKLTATDTGDKLWRLISQTNIDDLKIDEKTRELLRTNFFFKPLPCVSRGDLHRHAAPGQLPEHLVCSEIPEPFHRTARRPDGCVGQPAEIEGHGPASGVGAQWRALQPQRHGHRQSVHAHAGGHPGRARHQGPLHHRHQGQRPAAQGRRRRGEIHQRPCGLRGVGIHRAQRPFLPGQSADD